jgi:hypothetical protein
MHIKDKVKSLRDTQIMERVDIDTNVLKEKQNTTEKSYVESKGF